MVNVPVEKLPVSFLFSCHQRSLVVNVEPKALPTTFVHLADFNFSSVCLDLSFHLLPILNLLLTRLPCECSHMSPLMKQTSSCFPQSRCCGQSLWCLYLLACFVSFAGFTHITRCVLSDFSPGCYRAAHVGGE